MEAAQAVPVLPAQASEAPVPPPVVPADSAEPAAAEAAAEALAAAEEDKKRLLQNERFATVFFVKRLHAQT